MSQLVDLGDDLQEAEECEIRHLLVLEWELEVSVVVSHMASLFIEKLILIFKLPDEQESVSYILVGRATILINNWVSDFSDLVDKQHNLRLKDLSWVSEISDIAEPKYCLHLLSRQKRVDITICSNICADNLRSGFSKAKGKQVTDLEQCLFYDLCLILRLVFSFFLFL